MTDALTLFRFPGLATTRMTLSPEALKEIMRGRIPDPSILNEEGMEPFFWSAEISNDRLDSYFTHMDITSLTNYAADATSGVSFLDSHEIDRRIGMSLNGKIEQVGDKYRALADFFTLPGINFAGKHTFASTTDFIRFVRGIGSDVSIGFHGGRYICDICGEPVWGRTECPHIPGIEYPVGDQGRDTVVATATIYDAHLAEVSAVYDGATPEAMILKIGEQARGGGLSDNARALLTRRYSLRLPDPTKIWAGVDLAKRSNGMDPIGNETPAEEVVDAVAEVTTETTEEETIRITAELEEIQFEELPEARVLKTVASYAGAPTNGTTEEAVRWMEQEIGTLRKVVTERDVRIATLEKEAADGRTYRADLIDETIADGTRAMGTAFDQASYREILQGLSLERIKAVRAGFIKQGDQRLPGGRVTTDTPQVPQPEPARAQAPAAMFMV